MILETRLILDHVPTTVKPVSYRDIVKNNVAKQLEANQSINQYGWTNGLSNEPVRACEPLGDTNTKSLHQMVLETLKQPTNTGD